jgi:PAS domain-containing protein
MRSVLLVGVLVACRGSESGSCAAKLDELARFYDAVAADNATVVQRPALQQAAVETDVRHVPAATGAAVDLRNADVLFVGPAAVELVGISGEIRRIEGTSTLDGVPDHRPLVIEIDERVPWQRVEEVRQLLGKTDRPYPSVGVAYRVDGARSGRAMPPLGRDHDIPAIGVALAKTTAAHCHDYASQLAAFGSGGIVSDPVRLRMLGATISHCDCGADTALIEVMPWLVAEPLVTVVPLASEGPALHGADGATWGDLVRIAKGPVAMAMPASLPPPPPPPPPHRR